MRIIFTVILLISITSCSGQTKEKISTKESDSIMTKQEVSKIPKDAFQMNINFDDNPVWVWAKYNHNLSLNDIKYDHIYGINYWDEEGDVRTLYYEKDREIKMKDSIDFSNNILKFYPGDKTLQLISREADTLVLFNVLENKSLSGNFKGKKYKRIPTVSFNDKKEKVSDYDVRINYSLKSKSFYEVTIISDEGINTKIFKSNCDLESDFDISYYDLTNNRIYLLQKDCYLEKVDL